MRVCMCARVRHTYNILFIYNIRFLTRPFSSALAICPSTCLGAFFSRDFETEEQNSGALFARGPRPHSASFQHLLSLGKVSPEWV